MYGSPLPQIKGLLFSVSGELFILSVYDSVFVPQLSYTPLKWQ